MEYEEQPNDPFTLFNLATAYQEQGRTLDALDLFRRSLDGSAPTDSIVRKLYAQIIHCNRQLGQVNEAKRYSQEAIKHFPDDLEIRFQEALTKHEVGDRAGAIASLEHILASRDQPHFASVDSGLGGYKTRHNLAVFYRDDNRFDEAGRQWQLALEEQPDYLPAMSGIAEIALARHDWPAVDTWIRRMEHTGKARLNVDILRARKFLALREFSKARKIIDDAIAEHPQAEHPRVILTHILLQEGIDHHAAERALRDVLAMNPKNSEVRHNLELLLRQKPQKTEAVT